MFLLEEKSAISFFMMGDDVVRYMDSVDKSKSGFPFVRFLISSNNTNITLHNERRNETENYLNVTGVSQQMEVFTSTYSLRSEDEIIMNDIELESGGVYTILIGRRGQKYVPKLFVTTQPNSITMALLVPQFFIMSMGEEAPESMKAVMTSVWLLTEAVGNVLIIIITRLFVNVSQ
ncbi:Oligopeptide transporter, partial [Operophtera brumata]